MELEDVVVILSIILFTAQVLAWRWARGIEKALDGQVGAEAMGILSGVLGWTLVARVIGLAGLGVYDQIGSADAAFLATVVAQVMSAIVFLWATYRVWRLRGKTPVNGAGEAMAESEA